MKKNKLVGTAAATVVLAVVLCVGLVGSGLAAGAGAAGKSSSTAGSASDVLRIGTVNYIDSLNPYNYVETQAYNAMIMIYPQLVQYGPGLKFQGDWASSWKTSTNGKDWTFRLRPNTKWSDGEPLTAADAAWTINTTVKYGAGATAQVAPTLSHVKRATAVNPTTLVIHYEAPVGNVLAQLEQFFILPQHVWQKLAGPKGKGLKTYHPELHLPIVTGGAYTITQYEKKGTTAFKPDPNFYGPKSHAAGIALTYYTNSDAVIADLKANNIDWADQVPFKAVNAVKKDKSIVVTTIPGSETTNITWNSNPVKPKNRELLQPAVKKALSMCVDRDQIIDVVFSGYASKVDSIVGHNSALENPNLGPLRYNCAAANKALDALGLERGSGGIRVVPATSGKYGQPAHPMQYEIVTPTSTDFNVDREFSIVKAGFAKLGVKVKQKVGGDTTATFALETGDCSGPASKQYTGFDIAMWDWVGYIDPDFMLSVVTRSQWCSWSDTGANNPAYDKLYDQQGRTVNAAARRQIVYRMQKVVFDNFYYTQLVNEEQIEAHLKTWTGFQPDLNAYSKLYYTSPRQS